MHSPHSLLLYPPGGPEPLFLGEISSWRTEAQTRDFQILAREDVGGITEGVDSIELKCMGRSTSRTINTVTESDASKHFMPSQQKKKKICNLLNVHVNSLQFGHCYSKSLGIVQLLVLSVVMHCAI